ncbi:MAG: hypothetical protein ACK55I_32490, partial [bacterium]
MLPQHARGPQLERAGAVGELTVERPLIERGADLLPQCEQEVVIERGERVANVSRHDERAQQLRPRAHRQHRHERLFSAGRHHLRSSRRAHPRERIPYGGLQRRPHPR